jgi:hypothetical protein
MQQQDVYRFYIVVMFRYLSLAVIRDHLPLPSPQVPSDQLALGFIVSLVSMLSLSIRLLGVVRGGKFLILGSTYPRRLSVPEKKVGFDRQGCDIFEQFSVLQKIRHFYEP